MTAGAKPIALVGAFDLDNYGNLLFPIVFAQQIRRHLGGAELRLFAPRRGSFQLDGSTVSAAEDLAEEAAAVAAIVIGGGAVIRFDAGPYRSHGAEPPPGVHFWVTPTVAAAAHEIPVLWNAPSVPYSFTPAQTEVAHGVLTLTDYLSVRDGASKERLPICSPVRVVPDSVFTIAEVWPKSELAAAYAAARERWGLREPYVVFHLSRTTATFPEIDPIADALQSAARTHGVQVVLLPLGPVHGEIADLRRVQQCHADLLLVGESIPLPQRAAIIAHGAAFVGSSLHGNITAFAYGVPRLVVNTAGIDKLSEFCALTGSPQVTAWAELAAGFAALPRMPRASERVTAGGIVGSVHDHFATMARIIGAGRGPTRAALARVTSALAAECLDLERSASTQAIEPAPDPALEQANKQLAVFAAKAAAVTAELDRLRQRRILRWADRVWPPRDQRAAIGGMFQPLLDDAALFYPHLRRFRLRPSRNLQAVLFLRYPLETGVANLCGLRLAPLLEFPCAGGVLGIEIVSPDDVIVVHQVVALADVAEDVPTAFDFAPIADSDRGGFQLRLFVRDAPYPVRVYEWYRPRLPGLGRPQIRSCCAFVFETDRLPGDTEA